MEIAVITRHAVDNYGSVLQAYATQCVLEDIGHDVRIIDYVRDDELPRNLDAAILKTKPSWNGSAMKRVVYLALRRPETLLTSRRMARDRSCLLRLTRRYASFEELSADPPGADVYVTGSDQVWGPVSDGTYDLAYALAFAPQGTRRVSYAASLGKRAMPEGAQIALAKELQRYSSVLVREDSAVERLAEWEIEAQQVLDPTLLLDKDAWRRFGESIRDERYVLVYRIHNDPQVDRYAERAARHLGLPLVRISNALRQAASPGLFRWAPTLGQFASYIDKAVLVVTDSFHGTAFSINMNTPFVEVLPKNGTEGRNVSILRLAGLESRVLGDTDDVALATTPIEWESVNCIIAHERKRSIGLLERAIAGELRRA